MIFPHFSAISKCCFFLEKSRKYVYNYHVDVFFTHMDYNRTKNLLYKGWQPFLRRKRREEKEEEI